VKLIEKTVTILAPGPFTDAEADAFVDFMELALQDAIEAAVKGVLDAARARQTPLADVAGVTID
jgi:hypothetical protein